MQFTFFLSDLIFINEYVFKMYIYVQMSYDLNQYGKKTCFTHFLLI